MTGCPDGCPWALVAVVALGLLFAVLDRLTSHVGDPPTT